MGELSEETKQKIDALSLEELAHETNLGNRSRFQNEKFAYVKTRYELLLAQCEDEHKKKTLELAQEANNIATNANIISSQALTTSKNSYRMAIFAVVISLLAILVQYFSK